MSGVYFLWLGYQRNNLNSTSRLARDKKGTASTKKKDDLLTELISQKKGFRAEMSMSIKVSPPQEFTRSCGMLSVGRSGI